MLGEERVDDRQRLARPLPSDESAEPVAEEEDAPVVLHPAQRIERGTKIWERQRCLVRRIKGADARRHPVLVERGVAEVAIEVRALYRRVRERRAGDECAPLAARGRV